MVTIRDIRFTDKMQQERGAVAVTVAIMLIVLVGFTALSIDIGYLMVTRNELQNVADAAALAASRKLGNTYQGMDYDEQQSYDCSSSPDLTCDDIIAVAQQVGLENQAGQTNISILADDVYIGHWVAGNTPPFTEGNDQPDAVRVIARRDSVAKNPITTFLAGVLGVDTVDVSAQATAALTGQSTADPGELELPVGIASWWFDNHSCNDYITFSPSNSPDSCAGWTSWEYGSNDANLRKILNEELTSPETLAGDSVFEFIGGDLSNPTFDALESLFQRKGYDVHYDDAEEKWVPILDEFTGEPLTDATDSDLKSPVLAEDGVTQLLYPDGTPRNEHRWPTQVVVFDQGDCSNPNQAIKILGFARVMISEVQNAPDKTIRGFVECEYVTPENTRGGGGSYGTKGPISGLVE